MKDLSRTKNRVKSLLFQFEINIPERFTSAQTRHWSKEFINWLKALSVPEGSLKQTINNYVQIGESQRSSLLVLNRQVRALSQTESYKRNYLLLISIPGIGVTTAMHILTQLGDIRRFERLDDLCNYVGIVPTMHGSGERMQTGKMIKRGRKELKIMLIEASWEAIRKDPALMAKFNELSLRMNKNKAIIRIARKMLSRIRYVLIHQEEYQMGIAC
jgi:transposase